MQGEGQDGMGFPPPPLLQGPEGDKETFPAKTVPWASGLHASLLEDGQCWPSSASSMTPNVCLIFKSSFPKVLVLGHRSQFHPVLPVMQCYRTTVLDLSEQGQHHTKKNNSDASLGCPAKSW